jgi:hypothetical protein
MNDDLYVRDSKNVSSFFFLYVCCLSDTVEHLLLCSLSLFFFCHCPLREQKTTKNSRKKKRSNYFSSSFIYHDTNHIWQVRWRYQQTSPFSYLSSIWNSLSKWAETFVTTLFHYSDEVISKCLITINNILTITYHLLFEINMPSIIIIVFLRFNQSEYDPKEIASSDKTRRW